MLFLGLILKCFFFLISTRSKWLLMKQNKTWYCNYWIRCFNTAELLYVFSQYKHWRLSNLCCKISTNSPIFTRLSGRPMLNLCTWNIFKYNQSIPYVEIEISNSGCGYVQWVDFCLLCTKHYKISTSSQNMCLNAQVVVWRGLLAAIWSQYNIK